MEHQDKAASIVHSAKNRLQLLQPKLDLLGSNSDPQVQKAARVITRELADVNQQLVLMLSLYRLDQSELLNTDQISVIELVENAVDRVDDPRIFIDPLQDLDVFADERLLLAALVDALHNALKYCKKQVRVTAKPKQKGILIQVFDDGGEQPTGEGDGTGVGLWIANKIAEAHRNGNETGYAHFAHSKQQGSAFEVYIP
jgi:signal transduction histidine kinase